MYESLFYFLVVSSIIIHITNSISLLVLSEFNHYNTTLTWLWRSLQIRRNEVILFNKKSVSNSKLQEQLDKDLGMNSNAAKSKHGTWRDSMSGMARSVLLKAKDSIDTLRGASDPPRT